MNFRLDVLFLPTTISSFCISILSVLVIATTTVSAQGPFSPIRSDFVPHQQNIQSELPSWGLTDSQPEIQINPLPPIPDDSPMLRSQGSDSAVIGASSIPQESPIEAEFGNSYFENSSTEILPVSALILPSVRPLFTRPAQQTEQSGLLESYLGRAEQFRQSPDLAQPLPDLELPVNYRPWWSNQVASTLGIKQRDLEINLNSLLQNAISYSPQIQVAAAETQIRSTSILEEMAQFDWQSFLESQYTDTNDPIGNTLTTGNNDDRFKQQEWFSRSGFRRKNVRGGETELSQRFGFLDSNSRFLIPPNQGNSRLELNYRHPLMRGRGIAVNESLIVLADIDFRSASDTFVEKLQGHLFDVTETYWELVRARAEYLQKQKVLKSAQSILHSLQARIEVDALDRQVFRAKAAVANRQAEIARALTDIKNAESRLRLLINDPNLISASSFEFTPIDIPVSEELPVDLSDAVATAIANRQDISRALREVTAANVKNGVAMNDLLPKLDLLIGTYVAGLDGNSDFLNSWVNQFRDGRPGFNIGFEFEIPVGNRSAIARQQRRQWEVNRSLHQFRATMEIGITEVEIAVREVKTAHQELIGRYHAMVAANNETDFLLDRWQTLPEIDDSVILLLENLLDSQARLADEESAFAAAQFDFAVSVVKLKQSTGTLFQLNTDPLAEP